MSPEVLASSRCTTPWRSAAPPVAIEWPAASRPCSTVGPFQPGVGWAATPGGLSTTTMSASSYTTSRPGTGSGSGCGWAGGGSVTSSHSPAGTPSGLVAGRPPTRTQPAPISSAAPAPERPGGAEEPVGEVPHGPAEEQPERHRPRQAVDPPRRAQNEDDHPDRDQGEHDGHRRADAERGA